MNKVSNRVVGRLERTNHKNPRNPRGTIILLDLSVNGKFGGKKVEIFLANISGGNGKAKKGETIIQGELWKKEGPSGNSPTYRIKKPAIII